MRKATKITMLLLTAVVAFTFVFPSVSSAAPEMTLRFANQVPVEHTATKLMHQVADEVK